MALITRATHQTTGAIIGAAIEIHRQLGPGLLEAAYQKCLSREFWLRGIPFEEQLRLPINYKGVPISEGFRIDYLVADAVIVELKSVEAVLPVHQAQLVTYLRLTGFGEGLLINFNVPALRRGIRRVLNPSVALRFSVPPCDIPGDVRAGR